MQPTTFELQSVLLTTHDPKLNRARRKMASFYAPDVSPPQLDETGQLPLLKRLQPRSFRQPLPKRYSQDPAVIRLAG